MEMKYKIYNKISKESFVWSLKEIWENEMNPEFDDYILCHFTGLLDKEGNEIYEGDILEYQHDTSDVKRRCEVIFDRGSWWGFKDKVDETDKGCLIWFRCIYFSISRIIGNIYENPELLE